MIRLYPVKAANWWLRSPNASNSNNFVNVNTDGTVNNNNANYSNGFAPGFYMHMGRPINSERSESRPYIKGGYNLSDRLRVVGQTYTTIRKAGRFLHGRGVRVSPRFHGLTVTHFRRHAEKKMYEVSFIMNSADRREARYQRRKAARAEKRAAVVKDFGNFETVFSFERLYESYRASVRGVGWKASTQRYKASALSHITKTQEELLAGKYRSRGFYEFDLVERGKPRHIRSVHISERVVQRCLCDYCLVPMLSRSFIYDNGASLRGKGYDFSVKRVTQFLASHYRKHGSAGYALVFDFSKYFDTARHEPIFSELERSGIDDRLVSLSKYFISNFGDVGLGLGSQISQIAALALPNKIDHYIKDVLQMKYYARYMDDGCIISESKTKLEKCLREIRRLCAEHGIRLNEKKTQIIKLSRGFTFVKVRFRYGANGKVIRKATYKGIKHMRDKLKIFRRWVDSGRMDAADVAASITSWRGHMRRFHSYYAAQSVTRLYGELFTGG